MIKSHYSFQFAALCGQASAGEGTQNLLCAYLAIAVFTGLAANTLFGAWWLDGAVALGIAGWAVIEGRRAWAGQSCAFAFPPDSSLCRARHRGQHRLLAPVAGTVSARR